MRTTAGQIMTQISEQTGWPVRKLRPGAFNAIVVAGVLSLTPFALTGQAKAQTLSYVPVASSAFPSDEDTVAPNDPSDRRSAALPERLRRTIVALDTREAPGTIIIDTGNTVLYYVVAPGRAIRYGVGVGREGFTWSGVQTITNKAEWPDWHPPAQMIARQPYLPRFMAGGPGNPLGARAMYLGSSEYRIHGTNDPTTIGKFVSSGCIRLTNEDVTDLFSRVGIGTRVVVMSKNAAHLAARPVVGGEVALAAPPRRAEVTTLPSGRQAVNLSTASLY
ncbi:Lipoprotein-anchoring transpeptidase ErfK/SrfK [Bradyrhizobium erythrophlei]|jgi:lipoprotein-anchoring transpeptidase ErfK/SrfK|uniref:Lipoprotein-anchoring transpeptidase ErfK/SrfK n=2 Tax=Bradyrhizobium erythrophlei TaxID=1437360 RepID=A0A1M7TIR9_9BRAD|nr:Lipoprotein-anchoring transpeptidase ErfK/SrfK [Bradyrhizobium erythrophlei]